MIDYGPHVKRTEFEVGELTCGPVTHVLLLHFEKAIYIFFTLVFLFRKKKGEIIILTLSPLNL